MQLSYFYSVPQSADTEVDSALWSFLTEQIENFSKKKPINLIWS